MHTIQHYTRPNVFHNLVCQLTMFPIAILQIVMQIFAISLHFIAKACPLCARWGCRCMWLSPYFDCSEASAIPFFDLWIFAPKIKLIRSENPCERCDETENGQFEKWTNQYELMGGCFCSIVFFASRAKLICLDGNREWINGECVELFSLFIHSIAIESEH